MKLCVSIYDVDPFGQGFHDILKINLHVRTWFRERTVATHLPKCHSPRLEQVKHLEHTIGFRRTRPFLNIEH